MPDYYLPAHRPPTKKHRDWIEHTSKRQIDLIIIHTAESGDDWEGEDSGAERVARYLADSDRAVSAHCAVDADSRIDLLPPDWIAFHCRNFNSRSWGIEFCLDAADWTTMPQDRRGQMTLRAARACAEIVVEYGVPILRLSGSEAQHPRARGFCGHADLDPDRRTDPGEHFAWTDFLRIVSDQANILRKENSGENEKRKLESSPERVEADSGGNENENLPEPPEADVARHPAANPDIIVRTTTEQKAGGYVRRTTKTRTSGLVGLHSRGRAVAVLKSKLIGLGYLPPEAARRMRLADVRTINALRHFQRDIGVDDTGEVDAITARALARQVPTRASTQ